MVKFKCLCEVSNRLSNEILKLMKEHYGDNFDEKDRFIAPRCIDNIGIENPILVFGLNPARISEKNKDRYFSDVPSRLLDYIPENSLQYFTKGIRGDLVKELTYPKYFKRIYELFAPFDYSMLWMQKEYWNILENKCNSLKCIIPSGAFKKGNKFLVFTDLFFFAEKEARKMNHIFYSKIIVDLIKKLFDLQLQYYKPLMVVIANAKASHFVYENIIKTSGSNGSINLCECLYDVDGFQTKIFFTSMLSGQRALDSFDYYRLQRDIGQYINSIQKPLLENKRGDPWI